MKEIDEIKALWRLQGLEIKQGADPSTLLALETKLGASLPEDFTEYLRAVDGMLQKGDQDCDRNGFAFWPASKMKSVPEECERSKVPLPAVEEVSKYLVFADYMQWSWAYAVCAGEKRKGHVITIGTRQTKIVAKSFTSFLRLYLVDAPQLYEAGG